MNRQGDLPVHEVYNRDVHRPVDLYGLPSTQYERDPFSASDSRDFYRLIDENHLSRFVWAPNRDSTISYPLPIWSRSVWDIDRIYRAIRSRGGPSAMVSEMGGYTLPESILQSDSRPRNPTTADIYVRDFAVDTDYAAQLARALTGRPRYPHPRPVEREDYYQRMENIQERRGLHAPPNRRPIRKQLRELKPVFY